MSNKYYDIRLDDFDTFVMWKVTTWELSSTEYGVAHPKVVKEGMSDNMRKAFRAAQKARKKYIGEEK